MQRTHKIYGEDAADEATLAARERLPLGLTFLVIISLALIGWWIILFPFVLW
jgi:hypothetical protein